MDTIDKEQAIHQAISGSTPEDCRNCEPVLNGTSAAYQFGAAFGPEDELSPELIAQRAEAIFEAGCRGCDPETGACRHPNGGAWVTEQLIEVIFAPDSKKARS